MIKEKKINNSLNELWKLIEPKRKYQIFSLLFLILITSLSEIVSISSIIPFISIMINPDMIMDIFFLKNFINLFDLKSVDQLRLTLTILFCSSIIISSFLRLFLLKVQTLLAHSIGADISIKIYNNSLNQKYIDHLNENSSNLISAVIEKTNMVVRQVILPCLLIVSSSIILTAILTTLTFINPKVTIFSFFLFLILYISIFIVVRKKLIKNSKIIDHLSNKRIKALQEGLGGIKHVILDALHDYFSKMYKIADLPLRRAQAINTIINQSPKYIIEAIGFVFIAIATYYFSLSVENISKFIPVMAGFALGAQRMLPLLQSIYGNFSQIKGSQASLNAVLILMNKIKIYKNIHHVNKIEFNSEILLNNISFSYGKNLPSIIKNVDFKIKKGQKIGIIGSTGSGKTTFINLIMGLLQPSNGMITVDGLEINENNVVNWMQYISYVPQTIFLADSSIRENIAFGIPESDIDNDLVNLSIEKAQLSNFINNLKYGIEEKVGERGIRISGGQLQRIGIARALYKKAKLIILDEATSALDDSTEKKLMETVYSLDKNITIIMIAHRLSSLRNCDLIIELNNSNIKKIIS